LIKENTMATVDFPSHNPDLHLPLEEMEASLNVAEQHLNTAFREFLTQIFSAEVYAAVEVLNPQVNIHSYRAYSEDILTEKDHNHLDIFVTLNPDENRFSPLTVDKLRAEAGPTIQEAFTMFRQKQADMISTEVNAAAS
jgi:hypothetical protein